MTLYCNAIIEWVSEEDDLPRLDRILWMTPTAEDSVTFCLTTPTALPVWQKSCDLLAALRDKHAHMLNTDPFQPVYIAEEAIPPPHRARRNRAWELIESLVSRPYPEPFYSKIRGRFVRETTVRTGCSKKSLYTYLRRYWRGGQTKNALLPHYDRCGGRGKIRRCLETKRGRPNKAAQSLGCVTGINVTEDIQRKFHQGIRRFYDTAKTSTLRYAYERTLEKYFHEGFEYSQGTLIPRLPSHHQLPTFGQFAYWYKKTRDVTASLKARHGPRRFQLQHRAVLGDSTQQAWGPGSLYQIDATIADVYLVSTLDRTRIIGRPTLYLIVDTFSRLVAGFSVSLEAPSWTGAMLALENAATDKVVLAKTHGIAITEEEWPARHLPETLLADRGELIGHKADQLANALGIRVANTPAYRPDWKGIVERAFRTLNDTVIKALPGAVRHDRERGDADYRLEARLDLHQFRQILIHGILDHNCHHRLDQYPLTADLIHDQVEPYPVELWQWGIENRAGHLRTLSTERLRYALLPTETARVTAKGIRFRSLLYTCDRAMKEQWFTRARTYGTWSLPIAYDPRTANVIFVKSSSPNSYEPCTLLATQRTFQDRSWWELQDFFFMQTQQREAGHTKTLQGKATTRTRTDTIIAQAQAMVPTGKRHLSASARTNHIRTNRAEERERDRQQTRWQTPTSSEPVHPPAAGEEGGSREEEDQYIPPPSPLELLRHPSSPQE